MIDTHCHLTASQFDIDRAEALRRSIDAGVTTIVNPGTDLEQSRAAIAFAEQESNVWAAVGVHPQDIGTLTDDIWKELETMAQHPRVVAIGEVGLERSSRAPALEEQEKVLEKFVALAVRVGKPLIFHVRDAHKEFRNFLERVWPARRLTPGVAGGPARHASANGADAGGVMHCFSGTLDDAQWYIGRGLLISIPGIVTFPNAEELRNVVKRTDLRHLLVETDSPYLAPQSYRGKRNEPAYVVEAAKEIARQHGISLADVERATDENAQRLFRFLHE